MRRPELYALSSTVHVLPDMTAENGNPEKGAGNSSASNIHSNNLHPTHIHHKNKDMSLQFNDKIVKQRSKLL